MGGSIAVSPLVLGGLVWTLLSQQCVLSQGIASAGQDDEWYDVGESFVPCNGCEEDDTVSLMKRSPSSAFLGGGPVMDMLSRRSALDKNFMRFGRSGSASRPPRAENFMRFGRAAVNDEFDRSVRGDPVNSGFIRFGRSASPVERLSVVRNTRQPGVGHNSNFLRYGRATDNFVRFGRGKDSFVRFGRDPADEDVLRYGRAKDNFMRFGRKDDDVRNATDEVDKRNNMMRFGRGKDSFVRFGRRDDFMRFGRNNGGSSNFVRFGRRSDDEESSASQDDAVKHSDEEEESSRQKRSEEEADHSTPALK